MTSARISRVWGTILLSITICLISFPAYAKYSGGRGVPNDPYQIATAADLMLLGETPEDYDKHFILTADIDLDPNLPGRKVFDKAVIAPHMGRGISGMGGFQGTRFTGVFDGKGHRIFHLTIKGKGDLGLFGRSGDNADIRSLGLVDVAITGSESDIYVGGLVGYHDGSITTSYSTGEISGGDLVGGLVGYNVSGSIAMSYSTSKVTGYYSVGGLVGGNSTSFAVTMCYSSGEVIGQFREVGGLVGWGAGAGINSFWDVQTSGQYGSTGGGTGLTTAEMQMAATFIEAGWDFWGQTEDGLHEIWQMPEGGGYPVLAIFNGYTPPDLPGMGTRENPYLISDAQELGATANHSVQTHYRLATSLDLSGIRWGMAVIPRFAGTFDGNGHTLSHLTITGEWQVGLFGELQFGAEVRDLGIVDADITGFGYGAGALAGYNFGDVNRCYSSGTVSGGSSVGGLVGRNGDEYGYTEISGTVTDCDSAATVSGNERVGGLVGSNSGSVATSYSSGLVSGEGIVGGLVGSNSQGSIVASYSTGVVDANEDVGGLVGYNTQGNIVKSYATGSINGNEDVGGLVGSNYEGSIVTSYTTGEVNGNKYVGGLIGRNDGSIVTSYSAAPVIGGESVGGLVGSNNQGSIATSYATGAVDGNDVVGGLVGDNIGSVTASYSSGAVSGTSGVGGLAGSDSGIIITSFWDMETSGQSSSAGGTGLTTAGMQNIDIFLGEGWDFVDEVLNGTCDYWQISAGEYPRLRCHFGDYPVMPEGMGTPDEPYLIRDARDLGTVWLEPMAHYRLESALDLSGITWSMAVIPWFDGTINGNSHTISNLYIQGTGYLGLFGQLASGGEVKTLGIVDCNIAGAGDYVGGLAGSNSGTATQCFCTGAVSGNENVGGLMGGNKGIVEQCYAAVGVSGSNAVGGLTGDNVGGDMSQSYSSGMVSGDEGAGGLVGQKVYPFPRRGGWSDSGTITECFWDIETSGQETSNGGMGLTTAEMQTSAMFFDWGINGNEGIWTIDEGNDYPRLWWEHKPGQPIATWLSDFLEGQGTLEDPYVIYTIEDVNIIATLPSDQRRYFRLGFLAGQGTQENPYLIETAEQIALLKMCPYESKWGAHFKLGFVAGGGTQENPYSIYTSDQLNLLGICPYELDKNFKLMADIDLSGIAYSSALIPKFKGTFDGNGHRISNLAVTTGENYVGMFGELEFGAEVRDLGVVDVNVTSLGEYIYTYEWPVFYVGGLVGTNDGGNVIRCYSTGVVGGCSFRVGGLIGENHGRVVYCHSAAMVISSDSDVGGLIGNNWDDGTVDFCYSTGAVTGDYAVGGLVGMNDGSIANSYSTGAVSGDEYVGGLAGHNYGSIANSYSSGAVHGAISDIGGLVGGGVVSVLDSVWDIETSGLFASAGGVGLTTAEMMNPYMLGLNGFANDPNWVLDAGKDYPRLAWEGTAGQIISEPGIDWLEGNGTAENPYRIDTAEQLVMLGRASALCDRHFVLGADIDMDPNLANGQVFPQAVIPSFEGVFDGGGHCVSGLTVTGGTKLGLFGRLEPGAEVKDLGVTDATIAGSGKYSVYIGELAGYNLGDVTNCYSTGSVSGVGKFSAVGGLVGYNYKGSVTDCYSTSTVSVIGTDLSSPVGGLIGGNRGRVTRCHSTGAVSGSEIVGGLMGQNSWGGSLICCYSTGVIIGESRVGGLLGSNSSFVTQCYSSGPVSGAESTGGLAGTNGHRITESYSTGDVNGTSAFGGLVGYNQADVIRCYSSGSVSGAWPGGGLAGGQAFFSKYISDSFWDTETTGQDTSYGGTGKTTAEMQTASTFLDAGWDFVDETANGTDDVWWIDEGQDYPRLWWEMIPDEPLQNVGE